jgi:uncharacterized glyoxalase superfamily protein PhnB
MHTPQTSKPPPAGWPRVSTSLFYKDPARMIDWLCEAFGFELRLKVEGEAGQIEHSELTFGDGVVMVGGERVGAQALFGTHYLSPMSAGGNTQNMMLYVDDVDAHCAQARAAGARIVSEPALHDYGDDYWADRSYGALDPEGHQWWVSQRIRTGGPG